ncbi:hypothetical protein BAUCODRAFT_66629 [Baudoinia panamericana UAMH 10762]|uniref:Uncharacterized protein n=1 Tax=Baudoinia panamericana (strain UAMH 10762) TaxID=717646 RepID=M2NFZ0_BAUPA|nr:uncharacterized protein BAUCODRAFT_66629 [Baudoinia panamericana UAMH 10762]EMC97910.1 hypothetical protein BAUCODRAFT_66629 [Baudoinia panamericana UAMH 10762]
MEVNHPRRILAVGAPGCPVLDVVEDLTGSAPALNEAGTIAGLTHEWEVRTAYYTATVPIWTDEIADADEWKREFLKPEAEEVVQAIGAYVYCFCIPRDGKITSGVEATMKALQTVAEHAGLMADNLLLAVALTSSGDGGSGVAALDHDAWVDLCIQYGFEFINYAAEGKNEYDELTGSARLKEALEAHEWAADAADDGTGIDTLGLGDDDEVGGFDREEAEMTAELFGMKAALTDDSGLDMEAEPFAQSDHQAAEVDSFERTMGKLLALKEHSTNLTKEQKKRLVAKALLDGDSE